MKSKIEDKEEATVLYYIEYPGDITAGDEPGTIIQCPEGPWDTREEAQEFLDAEVGAPGAKVVSYVVFGDETIDGTKVKVGVAKAIRKYCRECDCSEEKFVRTAIIDYLTRLGLL